MNSNLAGQDHMVRKLKTPICQLQKQSHKPNQPPRKLQTTSSAEADAKFQPTPGPPPNHPSAFGQPPSALRALSVPGRVKQ